MTETAPMPPIVLASRNRKKAVEMAALLEPTGIELRSLSDFPAAPEVAETGSTFAENAALKATETARAIGQWTLADDSGLMVDALDGAPGIYSARYAGEVATDAQNNEKLLAALAAVSNDRRGAQFVCHLALAAPCGEIRLTTQGICRGRIVDDNRGSQGFGYDPFFYVPQYDKTFGELSLEVKGRISHRACAFRELIPKLLQLFESG